MKRLIYFILSTALTSAYSATLKEEDAFKCAFNDGFVTDFTGIKPQSKRANQITNQLIFHSFSKVSGTAILQGNAGSERLSYIENDVGIHFLENTQIGNFNLTTIFYSSDRRNSYPVVHSRHVSLVGGALPSQSVGECVKTEKR